MDFEFVLFVQREDFVSVVWVWVGLREGEAQGPRDSYRDTQHTNRTKSTRKSQRLRDEYKEAEKRRKDRGETGTKRVRVV